MSEQPTQTTRTQALEEVAREFVTYWTQPPYRPEGGCGMCGGIPHSTTCYVGRIDSALARLAPPESPPRTEHESAETADRRPIPGQANDSAETASRAQPPSVSPERRALVERLEREAASCERAVTRANETGPLANTILGQNLSAEFVIMGQLLRDAAAALRAEGGTEKIGQ